jgi:hypothetical protein
MPEGVRVDLAFPDKVSVEPYISCPAQSKEQSPKLVMPNDIVQEDCSNASQLHSGSERADKTKSAKELVMPNDIVPIVQNQRATNPKLSRADSVADANEDLDATEDTNFVRTDLLVTKAAADETGAHLSSPATRKWTFH